MSDVIDTIEYNGFVIKIYPDDDPINPREFGTVAEMTCYHRGYNLGDRGKKGKEKYTIEQLNEIIERKDVISLPLYLMDHSGLRMSAGSFNDPWDSGQVGYIWMTKEKAIKEFGKKLFTKKVHERAIACMESEVEVYDKYLRGGFVGFIIEDNEENRIDSCWGFDDQNFCIEQAKLSVDAEIKEGMEADKLMAL